MFDSAISLVLTPAMEKNKIPALPDAAHLLARVEHAPLPANLATYCVVTFRFFFDGRAK